MKTKSKFVNEFIVGDRITIYGFIGKVVEICHEMRGEVACTYLKVAFDDPSTVGYQYEGRWYGGTNDLVSYGYILETH